MTRAEVDDGGWMGNLGYRMPIDVIGLDVDAYRGGLVEFTALVASCGPLPNTWISHSGRNDNSGIRFYRVPVGLSWVAGRPGIDIIQRGHRYAAVWPSIHPDGRQYGWWDQSEGGPSEEVPLVEDLPELPWPWVEELSRPDAATVHSRAVNESVAAEFVDAHDIAEQPSYIAGILAHFLEQRTAGHSRHDTMQHCLIWGMECVRAGIAAARPTISQLGELWVDAVRPDARRAELWSDRRTTEFEAMLRHAIGKAEAKSQDEIFKLHDDIAGIRFNAPPRPSPVIDVDQPAAGMFLDWTVFANRDTSTDRRWLVEGFWPWGRAMAVWAAAKAGKSELALYCAGCLALGRHPWTGDPVDPIDVAYFDYEMTEDDLDERLSLFGFDPLELGHLHYALLPTLYPLDGERGGKQLVELVESVGAQAVVIDTFSRAVSGEENVADTAQNFYRYTGIRLKALGVGYLRTDHSGKDKAKGQRGSSAKRDDVDVIWSQTRSADRASLDCSGSSRLSWVGPTLALDRVVAGGVVSYTTPMRWGWPAGTSMKAAELTKLGIPVSAGRPAVEKALRDAGLPLGNKNVLEHAIKYRRDPSAMGLEGLGAALGAALFSDTEGRDEGN
jgi:hypothetical protein